MSLYKPQGWKCGKKGLVDQRHISDILGQVILG